MTRQLPVWLVLCAFAGGCWVAPTPDGPRRTTPAVPPAPIASVTAGSGPRRPLVLERFAVGYEAPLVAIRKDDAMVGFADPDGLLAIFDATAAALRRAGLEIRQDYEAGGRPLPADLRARHALRLRITPTTLAIDANVRGPFTEATAVVAARAIVDDDGAERYRRDLAFRLAAPGDGLTLAGDGLAAALLSDPAFAAALGAPN